jgi:hypothetical protein
LNDGKLIGFVNKNPKTRKWESLTVGGSPGRGENNFTDPLATLIKKAKPAPRKPAAPTTPKGYEPRVSELDSYSDFQQPKDATVSKLRRMTSEDIARIYTNFEYWIHTSTYSSEIDSGQAAQRRMEKVLAERGKQVEVSTWGRLQPGNDFSDPNSYRVVDL